MRWWGVVALALFGCDDGGDATPEDGRDFRPQIGDLAVPDAAPTDRGAGDMAARDMGPPPDAALDMGSLMDAAHDAARDATILDAAPIDMQPDAAPINASVGCGQPEPHRRGGEWIVEMDFGAAAGGVRGFYITVPQSYDPEQPSALILGYPGTDWLGGQIRDYLRIEGGRANEIFVYPDPLWRDFGAWGVRGGWQLGPDGFNAQGDEDLQFTAALLDHLENNYCIDRDRVFVTGHSWGGDMAHVVACFLGDRVRAAAPAAANSPFWFASVDDCPGETATWTFFGVADDHFDLEEPGLYGDQCRDFWLEQSGCPDVEAHEVLDLGPEERCYRYEGCATETRYCLYGPAARHQIPPYFAREVMAFFRSF